MTIMSHKNYPFEALSFANNAPSSIPIIKKDLQSERQINEISYNCSLRGNVICGILKFKTTAIELMPPYEVGRKNDDKCHQQCIDDYNSGSGVDAEDQSKRHHEFQVR